MTLLVLQTDHGPIYWRDDHCVTDPADAKRFASPEEAEIERWQVAGTDFQIWCGDVGNLTES